MSVRTCVCAHVVYAQPYTTTLRHLRVLREVAPEINAIMGPLSFDNCGVIVDVGVMNKRVKVVVKDECRWIETRNLIVVNSPNADEKWFPGDVRVGDKVQRADEVTSDAMLDNGRVGDVVEVADGVLVKAEWENSNSKLWLVSASQSHPTFKRSSHEHIVSNTHTRFPTRWYPEQMLKRAALTHVFIQTDRNSRRKKIKRAVSNSVGASRKINVEPSDTPGKILTILNERMAKEAKEAKDDLDPLRIDSHCFVYRREMLANHISLAEQDVQNCATLVLSKRQCVVAVSPRIACTRCMRRCVQS